MADDWQAGDEGVCIRNSNWKGINFEAPTTGPQKGDFIKVVDVEPDLDKRCCGAPFLEMAAWPGIMWCSTGFRKLRRDNQAATRSTPLAAELRRIGQQVPA